MIKSYVHILLLLAVFYSRGLYSQNVVRLNADNRHYLSYQSKPIILTTAAEHYGALIKT